VARHLREIAVEIAPARIAKGGDAVAVDLAIRLQMRGSHEPKPNDADSDRTIRRKLVHASWACIRAAVRSGAEFDSFDALDEFDNPGRLRLHPLQQLGVFQPA